MKRFLAIFVVLLAIVAKAQAQVETITPTGAAWVASTWGYSTPKLLSDGKNVFAIGLAGTDMDHCVARLFWRDDAGWHRGADLSPVYQPATIVLDSKRFIYVFTTQKAARGFCWKSKSPSNVEAFDQIPLAEPEKFAYGYLGAASYGDRIFLAGLDPQYNLWFEMKDSADAPWGSPMLIAAAQKDKAPWTSPTYPMILPDDDGVDIVYSNSPDGGVHNTYNKVQISRFEYASKKMYQDTIAEGPIGEDTYGLDALKLKDGTIHVLYFAGLHVYGDVAPDIEKRRGLFCAMRDGRGKWLSVRITTDTGTGQLFYEATTKRLWALQTNSVGAAGFFSTDNGLTWTPSAAPIFSSPGQFLHTIKPSSGSVIDDRLRALQSTASHALEYIELQLPNR